MTYRGSLAVLAVVVSCLGADKSLLADDAVDFRRDVGPLLTKRCAGCHDAGEKKGGLDLTRLESALAGGDSGPAIVPGKADESLLWQRIDAKEMPPKHPLSAAEMALVKRWLAAGATWAGGPLDPLEFTSDHRAGYDWWALQPVGRPTSPSASVRARNPIDAFIEQKLTVAKLAPSPEADRRTLVRRLYFGLTGLPPTPEDVAAFVDDSSPTAYEQLVDRLLASPAYGERWARHWLDIVRFGESQGFERDKLRTNSWRYRDWVIDAFNRDLPYDEFARLQLAGDILRPADADALVATGFLVAGPWDETGQSQQSAAMKAVVRQDEMEDLVGTVAQTFLGLTVNCARCHDHKFDPIRQAEYYQLCAALAGVRHGEPSLPAAAPSEASAAVSARLKARLEVVARQVGEIEQPRRDQILAARKSSATKAAPPQPIAAWEFNKDARDTIGDLHFELHDGPYLRNGWLLLEGRGYASTPPLQRELREKTLEAWVQLIDLDQRGGGAMAVETLDGQKFDAIVYAERQPRQWMAGSNNFARTQDLGGPPEDVKDDLVHVAITYAANNTITAYRNGRQYGKTYKSAGLMTFAADAARVTLGVRHTPPEPSRLLRCAIDRARLYDRALSAEEIAASAGVDFNDVPEKELVAALSDAERVTRTDLRFELDQLRQALTRLADRKVYAVKADKPEATFLLHRGNPADRREPAPPGGIASLRGVPADFKLATDATDAARRGQLAAWITSPENPLFARVIANRLWQYHFGVGLVDTPNDFGFNGGRPSHAELLDWLAGELVRSGWSLKHLQRLIVNSATYRQSSQFQADASRIDAANRLLWRRSPQRLEAETLRDTMLQLSGGLDRTPHGPGFHDFSTFIHNSQFYQMRDAIGSTFQRRTIYRTWCRSARSQLLDVFDCPDPSTKTPQRAVTTTPLQALSLLNNSFVLRMADDFASRVQQEAGAAADEQVQRVFLHALGRKPDETESAASQELVRDHGLAAFCRVMFNSNELLFVD